MGRKILSSLLLLKLCSLGFQSSSMKLQIMQASKMDKHQWKAANDLWNDSFYSAYKDLPFDQIDNDIKNASREALLDYLQRRFDNYRIMALRDSYLFALAYDNEHLVGYTLYHMLKEQKIVHIDHFAVNPNCQGKGIGKTILEFTIRSNPGIIAVVLTTRILNKQARCFYKKCGFYELDNIENLVFDPRYSMLLRKDIKS